MSQQDALNLVNSARARHGVPPLQWDDGLSHNATAWAEHEAHEIHAMRHSGGDQRPNQGENLFWSWSSNPSSKATFPEAMKCWLDEEAKYHGEAIGQGNLMDWGHYTQCLWRSTTHVGMGSATDGNGGTHVCGRFSPPGNWGGQRPY